MCIDVVTVSMSSRVMVQMMHSYEGTYIGVTKSVVICRQNRQI